MTITTQEFLDKFPQAKLNIRNEEINEILINFISTYPEKMERTWQTVGKLMKDYYFNNGVVFPKCNDMKDEFWISRGWDNPREKISELCENKPLPHTKEFWMKKGYSEDEAKQMGLEHYHKSTTKNRLLPTQLAYYTSKGMSAEDAKDALTKEQTKRTQKLIDKETANPELRNRRLWNQIEYWLNKGYTNEQGIQLMREQFESRNLQTMKKLVTKFQSEGHSYDDSLEKAQKDYKKRASKTMQTRIKNNSFGFQKASQLSLNFFKPLMDKLDAEKIEYYVGVEGNTEFFLASGTEYFYSYDFCIPSKKLIIEFHGEHVHPNPKMSKEKWDAWIHCWSRKSADECRQVDLKKIHLAESKGFKVIEVFESDNIKSIDII